MKLLLYVFTSLLCMVCALDNPWSDPGSGSDDQPDPGFCVEVIAYRLNHFYIYWVQPDIDDIEYYEVYYNVTVRYQTQVGERVFNDSDMIAVNGTEPEAVEIPLYTENSTYCIRLVAVTTEGTRVYSSDTIVPEEMFRKDKIGEDDAITFFQLGLDLVEPDTITCSNYEDVYESTLSLIRSQVTLTLRSKCNEVSSNNCNATLENDGFSCHNNSRLVYTARIVATDTINATMFMRYLSMADTISVLLHNGTNFINSNSFSCPLSIPSPEEVNCSTSTLSVQQSPPGGDDNSDNETTSDQESGDSVNNHDDEDSKEGDSIATVIAVAVGCSVGIVAMAGCVVVSMFLCNRCNHCREHTNSSDVEKGSYWDVSSYTISNQYDHRKTPNLTMNYPPKWCATLYNEYPSGSHDCHHDNDTASIKSHDHHKTNNDL